MNEWPWKSPLDLFMFVLHPGQVSTHERYMKRAVDCMFTEDETHIFKNVPSLYNHIVHLDKVKIFRNGFLLQPITSYASWTEARRSINYECLECKIAINVILTCSFQALRPCMVFPRSSIKTKEDNSEEKKTRKMIVHRHSSQTEMASSLLFYRERTVYFRVF